MIQSKGKLLLRLGVLPFLLGPVLALLGPQAIPVRADGWVIECVHCPKDFFDRPAAACEWMPATWARNSPLVRRLADRRPSPCGTSPHSQVLVGWLCRWRWWRWVRSGGCWLPSQLSRLRWSGGAGARAPSKWEEGNGGWDASQPSLICQPILPFGLEPSRAKPSDVKASRLTRERIGDKILINVALGKSQAE